MSDDLSGLSLLDLFRLEAETQIRALNEGLLSLETGADPVAAMEAAMRAAHSLKGAAQMVDLGTIVSIAHVLEDILVRVQAESLTLAGNQVDTLLKTVDLLEKLSALPAQNSQDWLQQYQDEIDTQLATLRSLLDAADTADDSPETETPEPDATGDSTAAEFTADAPMLDLFRMELDTHGAVLNEGITQLAEAADDPALLETLINASQAIRGAAKLVGVEPAAAIAQAMESLLLEAAGGNLDLGQEQLAPLASAQTLLAEIGQLSQADSADWFSANATRIDTLITQLAAAASSATAATQPDATAPQHEAPAATGLPEVSVAPFKADASMLDLFRVEVESQSAVLNEGLLTLEQDPTAATKLEELMRASHSIKGAARMVGVDCGVQLAHIMEDVFVAAQAHTLVLNPEQVDVLLRGVDMLSRVSRVTVANSGQWLSANAPAIGQLILDLQQVLKGETPAPAVQETPPEAPATMPAADQPAPAPKGDTAIRVSAESLNRLMGLAGEVRVESRWLRGFSEGLIQVKHRQTELISALDRLGEALANTHVDDYIESIISEAHHKADQCRHGLGDRLTELEEYDRRNHNLADRLNREVIASRMRPFGDGIQGFQRMVRDLARTLKKNVKLEIVGINTQVDRDILSKMEAPLNHLVRNAIDHGVETPGERVAAGKPEQATITIEAVHSSGMLSIIVRDDGRGIDPEHLRGKVVEKGLTNEAMAAVMSEAELMEFLFLPSFSTRDAVTEISGRGVGLDVVHSTVQSMRGLVRASSQPGNGLQFHMQLPLSLSVVRSLLVEVGGQPYAFPLARIDRTLKLHRDNVETMESRQYFTLGNQHIGILSTNQVLELNEPALQQDELPIVVLGERLNRYGLVVDRFLGERNLVVHTLDPRLGKVQDVAAAAILEDGNPCLILDVDDLLRSVDILVAGGRLARLDNKAQGGPHHRGKRVLVVDDSITVREVERNMLANRGYIVDVAVDGMDGWNAVRTGHYDLVISDIDMPRMNGFEFVEHIKDDPSLKSTPVMIVSYKDRDEDRARGLEVGADYYLTKGSFHDETLLDAVLDLIGEA